MRHKRFTPFLIIAILCAVMLRALIPAGYMPEIKPGKTVQMVVCSLDGFKTVTVDESFDPTHHSDQTNHTAKEPCEFASIGPMAVLGAVTFHIAPMTWDMIGVVGSSSPSVYHTHSVYAHGQSRAPPVTSA